MRFEDRETTALCIAIPVKHNGTVIGAVGAYADLSEIQSRVSAVKPFQTGYGMLISSGGQVVADTDAHRVGQPVPAETMTDGERQAMTARRSFTRVLFSPELRGEVRQTSVPIPVGASGAIWCLAVGVPLDKALAAARSGMIQSALVGVVSLALVAALMWWVSRSIARNLRSITGNLGESAKLIELTADHLGTSSRSLAEGSSNQAASLEETSASLEEIAGMTKRNAENAQSAKELASLARTAAEAGAGDMNAMNTAMNEIKSASDNIAKIIRTIDEIAFQTNILALNAAVEAARAGEAGMGFAVVAEEVRNLAQRSAQAARETAQKIEDSIRKSDNGVQISSKVASGLAEIVEKARRVDELVAEIAAASREQNQGITQVNSAVAQMDRITQANAASAEETSGAATELTTQSSSLRKAVESLRILVEGSSSAKSQSKPSGSPRNEQALTKVAPHSSKKNGAHKPAGQSSPVPVSAKAAKPAPKGVAAAPAPAPSTAPKIPLPADGHFMDF